MWAQLVKVSLKPGKEMAELVEQLQATEQPGSGLLRSTLMVDQKDPSQAYLLIVFESEEQARVREQDSHRSEGMAKARAIMADIFAGPPAFTDLTVLEEWT